MENANLADLAVWLAVLVSLALASTLVFRNRRAFLRKMITKAYRATKGSGDVVIWIGKVVMAILAMIALWYVLTHGIQSPPSIL